MSRLGDMIGKTLKVDLRTLNYREDGNDRVERGRYARICVELDLQKRLIPRVIIASALYNVEYEGLDLICFTCGRYGHKKDSCPWNKHNNNLDSNSNQPTVQPSQPMMSPEKSFPIEGEEFGPWMFVKGRGKVRNPMTEGRKIQHGMAPSNSRQSRSFGLTPKMSRFAALADCEEGKEDLDVMVGTKALGGYSQVKSNGQMALYDTGESGSRRNEARHVDLGKAKMSQKKSYVAKEKDKGKENVDTHEALGWEIGEPSGSMKVGRELESKVVGSKKNQASRTNRSHVVVCGSMEKSGAIKLTESSDDIRETRSVLRDIGNITM